jgi:hypothetical protein
VAFAFACVAVPWILYVLAFRRGGEELSVITPIAVFAAFVATAPRREDQKSATALVPSRV